MKRILGSALLSLVLLFAAASIAASYPLQVLPSGEPQTVTMCPDCSRPPACARVGDYRIALAADVDAPRMGRSAHFVVWLTDRNGKPAAKMQMVLVLSTPDYEDAPRVLPMKQGKDGRYTAETCIQPDGMIGPWRAEVRVTTPKGDVVSDVFTVIREPLPSVPAAYARSC